MAGVRAEQKRATRERVLSAARALFVDRAFDDVGVREIAVQAGVATGTVIAAFGSKGDLLNAIVIEDFERQIEKMRAQESDVETTAERLMRFAQTAIGHHAGQLPVVRASMADGWTRSFEAERRVRRAIGPLMALLRATLERGQGRGEVARSADVEVAAELILEAVLGSYRKAIYDGLSMADLPAVVERRLALLLDGFAVDRTAARVSAAA